MSLEEAILTVLELDGYKFHIKEKDFAKGITPKGRTCAIVLKLNKVKTKLMISKKDLERLGHRRRSAALSLRRPREELHLLDERYCIRKRSTTRFI